MYSKESNECNSNNRYLNELKLYCLSFTLDYKIPLICKNTDNFDINTKGVPIILG